MTKNVSHPCRPPVLPQFRIKWHASRQSLLKQSGSLSADTTSARAFAMAARCFTRASPASLILIVKEGLINLDYADVRAVMREKGKTMMGVGEASGEKRVLSAAEAAISNPLIEDPSIKRASGLLISITGGKDLTLFEVDEAASRIREEADQDANIIVGATFDDSLSWTIGLQPTFYLEGKIHARYILAHKPERSDRQRGSKGGVEDGLGDKARKLIVKEASYEGSDPTVPMFLSARENAQPCAVDCAPYVHAKLQAVHHEHGSAVRYNRRPVDDRGGVDRGQEAKMGGLITAFSEGNPEANNIVSEGKSTRNVSPRLVGIICKKNSLPK